MAQKHKRDWDQVKYHGRYNRYPFTEVVSYMMGAFSIESREATKVLDLGCGGAHHLLFLAEEKFDYFGVDGSQEALDIAKKRLAQKGYDVGNRLAKSYFDDLPYKENTFDVVIDRGSIVCNKLEDIPPLINEVRRILKPGGRFFSMILNEASTAKNAAKHIGNNDYINHEGRLEEAGVLHYTNTDEMKALFSAFSIDSIEHITKKMVYPNIEKPSIDSWSIMKCRKP